MFLSTDITVRKTKKKGRGVFATKDIPAGSLIGDYQGVLYRTDQGPEHEGNFYDMWYSDKVDICPDPKGRDVHLLNTSCEPNCAMWNKDRHTLLFALRKIFRGEELTYDYVIGPPEEDTDPSHDICHCGAPQCRGTMYTPPAFYDAWDDLMDDLIGDYSEKPPVKFGTMLPPLDRYPKNIKDHTIFPIFGCRGKSPHLCKGKALPSAKELRNLIRETGRQLSFPGPGLIVEAVLHGGDVVVRPKRKTKKK